MAVKLERPILMGGIGLSLGLWLLQSLQHSASEFGQMMLFSLALGSAGLWWWKQQGTEPLQLSPPPESLNQELVEKAITQTRALIQRLATETATQDSRLEALQQQTEQLKTHLQRTNLNIALVGNKGVGKTALLQRLQSDWLTQQSQTLSLTEVSATDLNSPIPNLTTADVVLFVTGGDLTDPEFKILSGLVANYHRVILVWNKQDQYLVGDQPVILQQLKTTLTGVLSSDDIIAIAASPNPVKVRQHQEDGTVQEWLEAQSPILDLLTKHLDFIVTQEQQALVLATTYREALGLRQEAKEIVNQLRREQALPLIEQYQWIAAAATVANPVPALDMLATAAVNAQLVMDLGAIYQQKFSLQQGQEVATTISTQMLKLGFVEISTQTLTSLLKSNTVTFIAGSLVQGVSAAYLTRIAGLSLIEYFQAQDIQLEAPENPSLNWDNLKKTLQTVFQQNQQASLLQSFVTQAINYFTVQFKPKQTVESSVS
ncbi:slr1306 family protein [Planktothrix pseudagardhii]|uniref:DUF697 domain-containing protein n=1 Tax=Planktothrix pseudagardhii TaxID=132604 RepID=A0A9W4G2A3_9CYAN|nr:DUF697 domain-containing protein [Planktothrix pseudagardhii]CAD5912120.1 hypothetical protein NO713_00109 [Planktothrix pseudagardhii]